MPTTVTKTIRSSGGDYTTLSAWEAAQQGNLVSADEIRVAECYDDWPSGAGTVTIDGSTTDSTRYLKITVAAGHRHDGTQSTGFWIANSGDFSNGITAADDYTVLEWCVVSGSAPGGTAILSNATGVKCINCIAENTHGNGSNCAYQSQGEMNLYCCVAPANANSQYTNGFYCGDYKTMRAYNCIASNYSKGFVNHLSAGTFVVKNCVAYNCTTDYANPSSYDAASTHNASTSATDNCPGGNSVTSLTSSAFVDAANDDFHLASGSVLIGAGTNLYSTFTTDIDGDTWPSSGAWDIGFDYRTGGAAATSISFSPRFPRAILNF